MAIVMELIINIQIQVLFDKAGYLSSSLLLDTVLHPKIYEIMIFVKASKQSGSDT